MARLLTALGRLRLVAWIKAMASSVIWGHEDQTLRSRRSCHRVRVCDGTGKSVTDER